MSSLNHNLFFQAVLVVNKTRTLDDKLRNSHLRLDTKRKGVRVSLKEQVLICYNFVMII